MKSRFTPQADRDLDTAAEHYNSKSLGIGARLIKAVRASVSQLEVFPLSAPRVHGDIRRIQAPPFKFGVFYLVTDDNIDVIRVLHLAKDPATWPE